ncbi:MAG: hypothetical protein GY933_07615 [Hyphomicrobiales bacterium]|nr:hypothetical protein [Hyphomicrobiales bacterium]
MTLADRIVIMRDGYIEQDGTPLEVFEHPINTFVATFIGSPPMNLISGTMLTENGAPQIALEQELRIDVPSHLVNHVRQGQRVDFGFRADDLMPEGHTLPMQGNVASLNLEVGIAEPLGTETLLFIELTGAEIQTKMLNPSPVSPGERLDFKLALSKCHLFDAETGKTVKA